MASRSLTEVFVLMRNNAIRNKHIYQENNSEVRLKKNKYIPILITLSIEGELRTNATDFPE